MEEIRADLGVIDAAQAAQERRAKTLYALGGVAAAGGLLLGTFLLVNEGEEVGLTAMGVGLASAVALSVWRSFVSTVWEWRRIRLAQALPWGSRVSPHPYSPSSPSSSPSPTISSSRSALRDVAGPGRRW